jgi:hypothetical protein
MSRTYGLSRQALLVLWIGPLMVRFLAALLVLVPLAANARSFGVIGFSGRDGSTCNNCHFNSNNPANVTLTGPTTLNSGDSATYTVTITGGPGVRAGFDLALEATEPLLTAVSPNTEVSGDEVRHTSPASFSGGSASFQVKVTAPPTGQTIKLYAAGISTNGSGSSGDYVKAVSLSVVVNGPPPNQPPTLASAAAAMPTNVTGNSAQLSALGADDEGEAQLSYTWATQSGPGEVTFSANGSNAAKATTATFSRAGLYVLEVTIADSDNATITSQVQVGVLQTVSAVTVTPNSAGVGPGKTQQFLASAVDQFGQPFVSVPSLSWSVDGGGTIDSKGLFTAGSSAGGPFTVTASGSGASGTAKVTVANGTAPLFVDAPTAQVSGMTASLSVLGDDDGGESALLYSWSSVSGPAPVTFETNDSNAAKNTRATFTKPGTYLLSVVLRDSQQLSATATLEVTAVEGGGVVQTTTSQTVMGGVGCNTTGGTSLALLGAVLLALGFSPRPASATIRRAPR